MIVKFKDPDDIRSYPMDWSWLAPDAIIASTWFMNEGSTMVIDDATKFTAYETVAWVSGGAEFETCTLTNRVNTITGRQFDYSIVVKIKQN